MNIEGSREAYFAELKERSQDVPSVTFVDANFAPYVPDELIKDPWRYLSRKGIVMKHSGEDADDYYKVFDIPTSSREHRLIAKIVAISKIKNGDPLLELKIIEKLRAAGLPCAYPVGYAKRGQDTLILYRKISGYTTEDESVEGFYGRYGKKEGKRIFDRLADDYLRSVIAPRYKAVGIKKQWRRKDFVFQIDEAGHIVEATPIDWERTKVDTEKLERAIAARQSR